MSSFSEKINQLQTIYRTQHDLSNQIAGANFAEERGHLSDDDRKDLEEIIKLFQQKENEETSLREEIMNQFPTEYNQYILQLQTSLTKISQHLKGMTGEIEFKHSFNKTICESLLADMTKLTQQKKIKSQMNWLFDVSYQLIEEYRSTLKLA